MSQIRIKDAAVYLGVSDDTLRRWIDNDVLSSSRDGSGRTVVDGLELAQPGAQERRPARRPLGDRPIGAQPVRRTGHRDRLRHRDVAGRAAVRSASGGVADEHRGRPRTRSRARLGGHRRREGDDGHRRDAPRIGHLLMTGTRARRRRVVLIAATVAVGLAAARAPHPQHPPRHAACAGQPRGLDHRVRGGIAEGRPSRNWPRSSKRPTRGRRSQLNFAGSADLVTQITEGAPADVFASADEKNMAKLTDADLVEGEPVDFATNVLEIAVPPANPAGIETFADLAAPGVKLVICAPEVPCGAATVKVEEASRRHADARQRGVVGHGRARQGALGRGGCRPGLRHRRDRRGRRGRRDRVRRVRRSGQHLPDRRADGCRQPPTSRRRSSAFVTGEAGQAVLAAAGFGQP